jgi:hypothetical protein
MKKLSRKQIVPSLVKHTEITSAYPGYRYVYFSSFEELNAYFTETCGKDWMETEWAKFWLRDHWRLMKQESREYHAKGKAEKPKNSKVPAHILKALIEHYQEQKLSLRAIASRLYENDGITLDYSTISKFMKNQGVSSNGTEA